MCDGNGIYMSEHEGVYADLRAGGQGPQCEWGPRHTPMCPHTMLVGVPSCERAGPRRAVGDEGGGGRGFLQVCHRPLVDRGLRSPGTGSCS